jgi:hypothetical protein
MNFVSWDDAAGWTDWIGLRPMTELEYTKAARGPRVPSGPEMASGAADDSRLMRVFDNDGEWTLSTPTEESRLSAETAAYFGASYWWVLDLTGGLWERVVSVGSPEGRAFRGTHGDGGVTFYEGRATNEDWPRGVEVLNPMGSIGIGYRGGGTYDHTAGPMSVPQSSVSSRRFGAWGEGPRRVAYGYRAVRSAPEGVADAGEAREVAR